MHELSLKRLLAPPKGSFFLFGPRSVGKSFWLRTHFGGHLFFDLLENRTYLEFSRDPGILEAKIGNKPAGTWICIDEIQKLPALLSEVHRLIEKKQFRFAMSGSSARKLKRGGADLLAGRAITKNLEGFSSKEIGESFKLGQSLEWGTLPLVVKDFKRAPEILSSYVHTYIKEEIKEEGLVRKVDPFIRFLEVAAIMNGQQLNKENIARDAKVPRSTVDVYFSILEDTLLGHFLPPFRPEAKVREHIHPKFYWFDPGVARGAAGLLFDPVDSLWKGWALETIIFHELRVYNETREKHRPLCYYRTGGGSEIDFVIETRKKTSQSKAHVICIEIKHSKKWDRKWERPMRDLAATGKVIVEKMFGVYCGDESYHFDGLDLLPVEQFLEQLHSGKIF
ncbi:MAG: ATP-binding protein [Deltaproteobacteria bacterium]|nr:ATP-binding protein [Deltaproteobacteria bacterium]